MLEYSNLETLVSGSWHKIMHFEEFLRSTGQRWKVIRGGKQSALRSIIMFFRDLVYVVIFPANYYLKPLNAAKHKWIKWLLNICGAEHAHRPTGYKEFIQPINQTVPCLAPQICTQLCSRNPECECFSWNLPCLWKSVLGHNPRAKPS